MKKFLLLLTFIVSAFCYGNADDYTYTGTVTSSHSLGNTVNSVKLGDATWTIDAEWYSSRFTVRDGSPNRFTFGSASNPLKKLNFNTDYFKGKSIKRVLVYSRLQGNNAQTSVCVKVGDQLTNSSTLTTDNSTSSLPEHELKFNSPAYVDNLVEIIWTNTNTSTNKNDKNGGCAFSKIVIEYTDEVFETKTITLSADNLVLKAGETVLEDDQEYELSNGTLITFDYLTDIDDADIKFSYYIDADEETSADGKSYIFTGEDDVILTACATSENQVSKTVYLLKKYPTECPAPKFNVKDGAEVMIGSSITVTCVGAEDLTWTVNDGESLAANEAYVVKDPVGTVLKLYALASVTGKEGELYNSTEIEVTVIEPSEVVFDFNTEGVRQTYGLTGTSDSGTYETALSHIESGIVGIDFTGNYRLWTSDYTLRVNNNATMTISVPDNYYITYVNMTGSSLTFTADCGTYSNSKWSPVKNDNTVKTNKIVFTSSATAKIKTISIGYALKDAEIIGMSHSEPYYDTENDVVTAIYFDYTLHVNHHKEGRDNYSVTIKLYDKDSDSEDPIAEETFNEHTLRVPVADSPRRIVSTSEAAFESSHKLDGKATFTGIDEDMNLVAKVQYSANGADMGPEEELSFESPITTSISEVGVGADGAEEWYDLSGRRVVAPSKGIFIKKHGNAVTKHMVQ